MSPEIFGRRDEPLQERVDHGVGDEAAISLGRPTAAKHEKLVELRCAVGPEHVGGFREGDPVTEMAGGEEADVWCLP